VLDVLYLVFNEGYTRSAGDALLDGELTREAIRLTRELGPALPDHDEVAGALALMLLTQARRARATDARGDLVPLAEQDRSRWRREEIAEGVAILERVLPRGPVGRFQLQAAIAAVHAEAPDARRDRLGPDPRALRHARARRARPGGHAQPRRRGRDGVGPAAGLTIVDGLLQDPRMARHHRTHAVRAHLLELAGDRAGAAQAYERAAALTASLPEQRYLNRRAAEARR
jgi:predicted RNA polymerase sigma factor